MNLNIKQIKKSVTYSSKNNKKATKNLIKWSRWEFSFGNARVWRFTFLICIRFGWSLECLVFVEGEKIEEPKTLRAFQTLTACDYIWIPEYYNFSSSSTFSWSFLSSFHYCLSQPLLLNFFPPLFPSFITFFIFLQCPRRLIESRFTSQWLSHCCTSNKCVVVLF